MLRAERRLAVSALGVRFVPLLLSWIVLSVGLLAAASVGAQAVNDSARTTPPVTHPAAPTGVAQPPPSGGVAQPPVTGVAQPPVTTPAQVPAQAPNPNPASGTFQPPPGAFQPPSQGPARATPPPITPRTHGAPFTLHLQGGLFSPIDVNAPSPTIGLRLGRLWLPHLQGGLLTSWTFRRKNSEEPVDTRPGLRPQRVLGRVDANLVPLMAFLQVNLSEKHFLVPYAAAAAGYEVLSVTANDFVTDQQAKASYSNFAWEAWGGFGMRLESRLRTDVEVFYNGGKLERDVTDSSGNTYREAVDMNGVGARVGLDILF